MASSGTAAAAAIGAAAIVGGVGYYFYSKSKSTSSAIASIALSASNDSPNVDQSVTLTAIASDANGNPVAGAPLNFYGNDHLISTQTTDATGTATFNTQFAAAGTYQVYAVG